MIDHKGEIISDGNGNCVKKFYFGIYPALMGCGGLVSFKNKTAAAWLKAVEPRYLGCGSSTLPL